MRTHMDATTPVSTLDSSRTTTDTGRNSARNSPRIPPLLTNPTRWYSPFPDIQRRTDRRSSQVLPIHRPPTLLFQDGLWFWKRGAVAAERKRAQDYIGV